MTAPSTPPAGARERLLADLRFIGRYGAESEDDAAKRRIRERRQAADEIERLSAEVERLRGRCVADGAWAKLSLSRLARVKAHREQFGSTLAEAVSAVDAEEARQHIAARARQQEQDNG